MRISDAPVDKHGKPLFPAPPTLSSDVKLGLHHRAEIRVRQRMRHVEDVFDLQGSLGDITRVAAVRQVIDEPQWIPAPGSKDEKGRGIWRRTVHFESAVAIPYAPTFNTEILDWQVLSVYVLHSATTLTYLFQVQPAIGCSFPGYWQRSPA